LGKIVARRCKTQTRGPSNFAVESGPFRDELRKRTNSVFHPTNEAIAIYKSSFDQINVLDMHNNLPTKEHVRGDPYITLVVCSSGRMPRTCQAAQVGKIGVHKRISNPSYCVDCDYIATTAFAAGLLRPGISRPWVVRRIQAH
jgi:hypothetical protein